MKAKTLLVSALCLVSLVGQGAYAANTKTDALHGKKVSLAQAKSESLGAYSDGTNVVIVNFSHDPVDVDVPDLGVYSHLGGLGSGDNVYYIYSSAYYSSVWVNVYDSLDGYLLASGTVDNPGTLEISDSYAMKASVGHSRPSVAIKHGIQ